MSVDRKVRDSLANSLELLVTGEMKTDDFDDRYCRDWIAAEDAAVPEIARFGWGLYSDDWHRRLTGWNTVTEETLQTSNRAILFLESDLEYE